MHGVVADISSVVRQAKKEIQASGLDARCTAVECDFYSEIPAGSDAYLMSHILHDWNDPQCQTILSNCHKAMQPGSRLLIVEAVIPAGNEFSIGKLMDLEVFVMGGGRERTQAEFRNLLESCGFQVSQIVPTEESISVIEAVPV